MNEDLRRIEEKQKLTNLQIDKRLSQIEIALDNKTPVSPIPADTSKIERDIFELKEQIVMLKTEKRVELEKMTEIANKFNFSLIAEEFRNLRKSVDDLRVKFSDKISTIESAQEQMRAFSGTKIEADIDSVQSTVLAIKNDMKRLERRIDILEQNFVAAKISQPIILE